MVKYKSLQLQVRTVRAWDASNQPSATGTVIGGIAAKVLYEESSTTVSSAKVHVEMPADRTSGMITTMTR